MTGALGVAGRSRSLFRGGERAGAPPSAREEGRGGHRGVSGAAAPGWGPPGGAGRGARAGASVPGHPRLLPSAPGGGPAPLEGLTRRWIELHHLPSLGLFCSCFVPLLLRRRRLLLTLLQGLPVASVRIISREPRPKDTEGHPCLFSILFLYFLFFLARDELYFYQPPLMR